MNIKQKTIKGIFWSSIQNIGSKSGSFIIFLLLARLLTPKAFGLVALANIFISFMQIFVNQGFANTLVQKQALDNEDINTLFWTQLFIGIVLTTFLYFTAPWIAKSFQQSELELVLKVLSCLFIISSLSQTQKALLRRSFNFKVMAIRSLSGVILSGFVGIYMAFLGYGVWSLVGQQLTYEIVGVLVLWTASDWRPSFQFSLQKLSELYGFSINLLGYKLLEFFNQRTDNLLIGYFLGEVTLGYYAIAHRILQVMTQLLIGTLNQVALSTFSRLQTDSKRFLEAFYRATQFTSLLVFPVFFAIILLSPDLVITLFGEKWNQSIPILQIISLVGILRAVSFFQRSAFIAIGKPLLQFKLGLVNSVLNIIACLIAIQWGIIAVAVAYTISDYLVFPLGQWLLSQLISLSWKTYLSQFIAPLISTAIMMLTLLFTQKMLSSSLSSQLSLMICSVTGTMAYVITLRLIFPQLFAQLFYLINLMCSSKTNQNPETRKT